MARVTPATRVMPLSSPPDRRPWHNARSFFLAAFEQRQRHESGFFTSDVTQGLGGSVTIPITGLGPVTFRNLTTPQVGYINTLLGTGNAALIGAAVQYAYLASSGGSTRLPGAHPLPNPRSFPGVRLRPTIGSRFFFHVAPVPGAPTHSP